MQASRPRFAETFSRYYVGQFVEKRLLGGKFVLLSRLLTAGGFLFENGAVLGRAFRDRFADFAVPFAALPGRSAAIEFVLEQGRLMTDVSVVANTVQELFFMHEMHENAPSLPLSGWAMWHLGSARKKVDEDFALKMGLVYGLRGAGFGAQWPDEVERLYVGSYANVDAELWSEAHAAGLGIPPEPDEYVPIGEREREAVEGFAEFCREFWPEYLAPLDFARWVTRPQT